MEAIATGLAVDATKGITKVVAGRAFEEIKDVWGFKNKLERLKSRFKMIQALPKDLGNRKNAAEVVDVWLQRVKDVAYAAENLMDDYDYEMLRREMEFKKINPLNRRPSFKKKCRNHLSPSTNPLVFRFRMTRRVKKILSDVDDLFKQANDIGIKLVEIATKAASTSAAAANKEDDPLSQIRKHADAPGSKFVGRQEDQTKLLQLLLNPPTTNQPDLPLIAIVGIGGLGKTTLARRIFDNEEVDDHFREKKKFGYVYPKILISREF